MSFQNSQTLPVLLAQATPLSEKSPDPKPSPLLEEDALSVVTGPLGTQADVESIEEMENAEISFYVVRSGDSLKAIAEMFEIKPETIVWANSLSGTSAKLKVGETLMIPPVDGVVYKIKKGDTILKIAKEFGASTSEIEKWNGFESGYKLSIGDTIMVPNGKITPKKQISKPTINSTISNINLGSDINEGRIGVLLARVSGPDLGNYFARPCVSCYRTQGIHGRTAVDLGGKIGTPILAAAGGRVIIAKDSGYNWGYAKFVVIEHPNGTQTLYAHMHKTLVSVGQQVSQGETVGLLGNTGHSTGPHLHFEVRGAKNPLGSNPNYGL